MSHLDALVARCGSWVRDDWRDIVRAVQQLPYGRVDSWQRVLVERRGTCSTKHLLIAELLEERRKPVTVVHRVYTHDSGIVDVHTYLRVDGMRIDATFPADREWDGCSDMPIACGPGVDHTVEDAEPLALKRHLIDEHCDPTVREPFIAGLSDPRPPLVSDGAAVAGRLRAGLTAVAVAGDVAPMAAYMKTRRPFLGVRSPARRGVLKGLKLKPANALVRRAWAHAMWEHPEREMRYAAIDLAAGSVRHLDPEGLDLYASWVKEGAWWDLVDPIASSIVGMMWKRHRDEVSPLMDRWIEDDNLWIRRVALLGQLKHRGETDAERLFAYCRRTAHESDFFIRKAIGWALRTHARHDPDAVRAFVEETELSGLSRREALKHLALSAELEA